MNVGKCEALQRAIARARTPERRGRFAYEGEMRHRPFYHDGTPRDPWHKVLEIIRWSWIRNPTPKP